jgi:hypothetical protein
MANKLLIFLCFLYANVRAQDVSKAILFNKTFFATYHNKDSANYLKMIDTSNPSSFDSLFLMGLLTNNIGPLYYNPVAWDIDENALYIIDTYEDHLGMNYAQLKMFNLNEIKRLQKINKDSTYNYINATKRLISRPITPVESYANMSRYHTGKIEGRIFCDMVCSKEYLRLYIYLDSIKKLETWEFTRYPVIKGDVKLSDKTKIEAIYKQDAWILISEQDLRLAAPFKVINNKKNTYLFDASGFVFNFSDALDLFPIKTNLKYPKGSIILADKSNEILMTINKDQLAKHQTDLTVQKINAIGKKLNN